jgi:hypothetical protein
MRKYVLFCRRKFYGRGVADVCRHRNAEKGAHGKFLLAFSLQVGLDEPQPLVHAAGNLGKEVGGVGIGKFAALRDGLPNRFAEERYGRR